MARYLVWATLQFAATHHWPEAPQEVIFLRNPHRHVFHVKIWAFVDHDNRDIEFISLKNKVERHIQREYAERFLGKTSCEMLGRQLLDIFPEIDMVSVSEDNENGAEVWR